ncbi:ATP-binding protein [Falsibacillus albus]|uniref:histidine kinase n=1 Tax=Falsibacillus albus TaxID=2478915 RepID=A0A3L7JZF0_9BACI|nr:ATP-binding protein [Falsibacillus albus]RLQ96143.1 response regulator [Falsibacillus albus]
MNFNQYVRKSLSRQFIVLMSLFILLFILGTAILSLTEKYLYTSYTNERAILVKKVNLARQIDQTFTSAMFDIRGYFAFHNSSLKDRAIDNENDIEKMKEDFQKLSSTSEDKEFEKNLADFQGYYFTSALPKNIAYFEKGQTDKVIAFANNGGTAKINAFEDDAKSYITLLSDQLNQNVLNLTKEQTYLQLGFILYILLILFALFRIIRIMVRQVGQPLSQFAFAANEIAKGKDAEIQVDESRRDELGALAIAFKQMVASVQEKEQDLLAHNEELLAQQDELQAQQSELESALTILRDNEAKLNRRNELIHHVSTSLNKKEVLNSIVINMSKIIQADRGIISMTKERTCASFGITEQGASQFQLHLESGILERLNLTKSPFTIKREITSAEKGYHDGTQYSYDLYLPVLSSDGEVIAVMVYSRFGEEFAKESMVEYEALAKQIGVTLDKIKIFEISEADRRLNQDILNTVQEGIQLIDVDGAIIQVNEQLCRMFPSMASGIGLPLQEWKRIMGASTDDPDAFDQFIEGALKDECEQGNTFTYRVKDSHQVYKVYCEDLYNGDKHAGKILVHRNITKEFEVDQMKSEFVSTVSHELRTPLASILGFTELMMNRELKAERQKKYLATILSEANRLTALINDFLDVQRMEAGKQTYEKKYIELKPILNNVINHQQVHTQLHHFTINSDTDNDVILGDKLKIEQIFTNLINNAIKYSPDGGTIKVNLYNKNDRLCVDIEDMGLGIPEEALDKIFTKFYRVDNTDLRRIGGTGLGLAIVQEIVKAHLGDITVRSTYGQGSIFTVSFPSVPSVIDNEAGDDGNDKKKTSPYKIMIIEDDKSLAELISQELSDSGFRIEHHVNGRKALNSLENTIPDAIVLDIMLAEDEDELDGWKIMKHLKEDPELKYIPIIVSTALDEKEKGFQLGANDYLIKPYKSSQLSKAIMQTLLKIGQAGQILVPKE